MPLWSLKNSKNETIIIGSDHAGYLLKEKLKEFAKEIGIDLFDVGSFSEEPVDYPDIAKEVASLISLGRYKRGVLICGTGIGMGIVANRFSGVRATPCYNVFMAEMSRKHNDSNLLVLGGRITDFEEAKDIFKIWISTDFEGGRHERRLKKIELIEEEIGSKKLFSEYNVNE